MGKRKSNAVAPRVAQRGAKKAYSYEQFKAERQAIIEDMRDKGNYDPQRLLNQGAAHPQYIKRYAREQDLAEGHAGSERAPRGTKAAEGRRRHAEYMAGAARANAAIAEKEGNHEAAARFRARAAEHEAKADAADRSSIARWTSKDPGEMTPRELAKWEIAHGSSRGMLLDAKVSEHDVVNALRRGGGGASGIHRPEEGRIGYNVRIQGAHATVTEAQGKTLETPEKMTLASLVKEMRQEAGVGTPARPARAEGTKASTRAKAAAPPALPTAATAEESPQQRLQTLRDAYETARQRTNATTTGNDPMAFHRAFEAETTARRALEEHMQKMPAENAPVRTAGAARAPAVNKPSAELRPVRQMDFRPATPGLPPDPMLLKAMYGQHQLSAALSRGYSAGHLRDAARMVGATPGRNRADTIDRIVRHLSSMSDEDAARRANEDTARNNYG